MNDLQTARGQLNHSVLLSALFGKIMQDNNTNKKKKREREITLLDLLKPNLPAEWEEETSRK